MSPPPDVSIVIVSRNGMATLPAVLEAIAAQEAECSFETVAVDSGSTDGTAEWLAAKDYVKTICEPAREGAVRAFNKGFRAATGHYVMWLNDDARLLPGAVEAAIQTALQDAASEGVHGAELTPYLLARIAELTDGESIRANIALLKNNAAVAADIAVALSRS